MILITFVKQSKFGICRPFYKTLKESAFEYLWQHRFLFRDRFANLKGEDFNQRIQEMTVHGQKNVERILADMRTCGMLQISLAEAHVLAINAWILHANWLGFLQVRETISEITEQHTKEGFAQMMWLFNPYWSEDARREAEQRSSEFSLSDNK